MTHDTNRARPFRVLVLGGGYAGLAFVQGLRRERLPHLEITLVDRNPFHTLLTETHSVAAGTRAPSLVEVPFSALGGGIRIVTAPVVDVDPVSRLVWTDNGSLPYDHLVFALGGRDNDFGTPGVQEHALFLRGEQDAARIQSRLAELREGAGVVIVGGGLTGVELAAEMAMRKDLRIRVTLVEAMPEVLPGLPAGLQRRARRRLGWLGVNLLTGGRVSAVTRTQVHLADGSVLNAPLVVWAAGVKGHPLVTRLGLETDRAGRVLVDRCLASGEDSVTVLGDSAAFRPSADGPAMAPSAQLAEQMGFAAAANLARRLTGRPERPFAPHMKGVLCDLGGLNASGLVLRLPVHGLLGVAAKRASVLNHLLKTTGVKGFLLHLAEQVRESQRQHTLAVTLDTRGRDSSRR